MIDLKGIGSEGAIVNLVISAFIIYQVYLKPKLMRKQSKDRRKNDANPHPAPGNATECKEHAKGLTRCEEGIKNIKEKVKEYDGKNSEAHKTIFRKLDSLKNRK